jgi:hypothetical protein
MSFSKYLVDTPEHCYVMTVEKYVDPRTGNIVTVRFEMESANEASAGVSIVVSLHPESDPTTARINGFDYSDEIDDDLLLLLRGGGARHMLLATLKAVVALTMTTKDPHRVEILRFVFRDTGTVQYSYRETPIRISLPILSILTLGTTWYERHFGACMTEAWAQYVYREGMSRLTTDAKLPLDEFQETHGLLPDKWHDAYRQASSYSDFLQKLQRQMLPGEDFCIVSFQPWLMHMLTEFFLGNDVFARSDWVIETKSTLVGTEPMIRSLTPITGTGLPNNGGHRADREKPSLFSDFSPYRGGLFG